MAWWSIHKHLGYLRRGECGRQDKTRDTHTDLRFDDFLNDLYGTQMRQPRHIIHYFFGARCNFLVKNFFGFAYYQRVRIYFRFDCDTWKDNVRPLGEDNFDGGESMCAKEVDVSEWGEK